MTWQDMHDLLFENGITGDVLECAMINWLNSDTLYDMFRDICIDYDLLDDEDEEN